MKEVLNERIEFYDSYLEDDFKEKSRELYHGKAGLLDQQEKLAFLEYVIKDGGDVIFMIFCEETMPSTDDNFIRK